MDHVAIAGVSAIQPDQHEPAPCGDNSTRGRNPIIAVLPSP